MHANLAVLLVLIHAQGPSPAPDSKNESRPDFSAARRVLEDAIRDRAFPGCAVAVGTSRGPWWKEGLGRLDYASGPEATPRTLYDLASLTKVVGTTSVVMALVRDGKLSIDDAVCRHVPGFSGGMKARVEIGHCLSHSSGLPAWKAIHLEARGHGDVLGRIIATDPEVPPGTREAYSDLGFMLLGEAAARAGGKSLADLERELVLDPLGLADTRRALRKDDIARTAPTEKLPATAPAAGADRPGETFTRGVVHDENAAAAGGGTGHAGLFSTADDMAVFATELLRARAGRSRIFPAALIARFTSPAGIVPGSSRALGWDTPSRLSSAGSLLSRSSFGHTGFTGTSIWVDPERDIFIVLLSNRVHPTRENTRIAAVRRALADAVALAVDAARSTAPRQAQKRTRI
jgi:serine-type D-Ala-D-Ala carboxypeptidase